LPAASLNEPADTEIDAVPSLPALGVNVAEYNVPEPVNPLNEPPDTDTSPTTKFDDDSDKVKVIGTVPPNNTVPEPSRSTVIVGDVRSTVTVVAASTRPATETGPGLPTGSLTASAVSAGTTVPSPQSETARVYEVPVPETLNEQPGAVPRFSKSLLSTPITASLKRRVYSNDEFVGDNCADAKLDSTGAATSPPCEVHGLDPLSELHVCHPRAVTTPPTTLPEYQPELPLANSGLVMVSVPSTLREIDSMIGPRLPSLDDTGSLLPNTPTTIESIAAKLSPAKPGVSVTL